MKRIIPLNDIMIVRLIENEAVSQGGIVLTSKSVEKSIRGEVMIANTLSFDRNGERRDPLVQAGDIVVMQSGSVGTDVSDAPDDERWIAVPEDCVYYIVKEV
ncbi:co-chaperonin [Shewanella sp. phage 1/44]|uniref:co-chaperonin GroES n=1 Tax=Shewanella sp. phage 1/44 TaxID=1458862 RepID=UPI0004F8DB47|nr:co-chaperonin GroES [Shewanella sp. phage 1/44]AHK11748.1 co-chaperonin [Shewanella sp. phage 1/44]